ncbi:nitrogen fixation protein NifZ [Corallincola luteus]|uniref:Nitrogen fixation protein NifZ n=1 Tax=Corallincola luteus TaxID=1775177 RepID=A0ABY2ALM4_9GAMM|nr:nitrogen fixation protein NifZ [Corallincola luteus]TCI02410.1 nitrogen fixation protein NifZ [Corallincola luteus]
MLNSKFEIGGKVRLIRNVRDDGSYIGKPTIIDGEEMRRGKLLVRRGEVGYVRHVGMFLQDQVIYQVHFLDIDKTIGCRENELIDGDALWQDNLFEYGDNVQLGLSLSRDGEVFANKGDPVSVLGVYRQQDQPTEYRVQWQDQELLLPEKALIAVSC